MKNTYTLKELAEILGISVPAVHMRASKERWPFEQAPNPRGGGICKSYPAKTLPKYVREAIGRHVLEATLKRVEGEPIPMTERVSAIIREAGDGGAQTARTECANIGSGGRSVKADAKAVKRSIGSVKAKPTDIVAPGGSGMPALSEARAMATTAPAAITPSVTIPDRAAADGQAKYRLVSEWRALIAAQPWGKKDEATQAFLLAYNAGRLLPSVYETVGEVSDKTLYRLDKKLRESGDDYHAISDGRGGWRLHGTTKWRPRDLCREAQEELLRCYLDHQRPSVTLAIRAARLVLKKRAIIEESSDATWRRWLHDYEQRHQHVIVLAREGEKAYKDKVGPYITRDDSLLGVGQVLVADGHDLNFQVLHPVTGKPVRMALITFFDWASRMPVGYQIMPTENTVAIQAALRMAILTLGKIPQVVYLDNGKAFKARVFTRTDPDLQDLTGIYARLGIATIFAQPYNARAKVLERWHLTLNEQCERIIPTYTGASIGDKPAWLSRNEKLHRAWHDARTQGWVPNIREAAHIIWRYCQWYAEQPHSGLGGRRPIDVLEAGRGPGVDVEALSREFLWRQEVTPRRCRVTLYGIDYESDALHGWKGPAIAYYDTADLINRIWIYSMDGAYIGEALPVQALHPLAKFFGDEVSVDRVKTELARHRRLEKQTREGLVALGAAPETVEGLKALPWNQREAVLIQGGKSDAAAGSTGDGSGKKDAGTPADLSPAAALGAGADPERREDADDAQAAEHARLQLVIDRAVAESEAAAKAAAARPKIERPEYFRSEAARYEWCFRTRTQHGQALDGDDEKFMAFYETTDEFQENFKRRYDDLRELYALYGPDCLGADG